MRHFLLVAVAESILQVTGEGYVAFYGLYDEHNLDSGLKLLNSFLIERGTKKMFVDEPVPLDVVKKAVKYTEHSVPTPVLGAAKIRGMPLPLCIFLRYLA
jgi:hypothetical protein